MSQISETPQNDDKKQEDDPLAELARIVSEGSIFGSVTSSDGNKQEAQIPSVEPVVQQMVEPEKAAPSEIINPVVQSDFVATHEKIESELIAEPVISAPIENIIPQEQQDQTDTAAEFPAFNTPAPEIAAAQTNQEDIVSGDDSSFMQTIEDELLDEITAAEAVMREVEEPVIAPEPVLDVSPQVETVAISDVPTPVMPEPTIPAEPAFTPPEPVSEIPPQVDSFVEPSFSTSIKDDVLEDVVEPSVQDSALKQDELSASMESPSLQQPEDPNFGVSANLIDEKLIASLEEEILKEAFPDVSPKEDTTEETQGLLSTEEQQSSIIVEKEPVSSETPEPQKVAAVEEALNLDSFFDDEFAQTTQKIANQKPDEAPEISVANATMGFPDVSLEQGSDLKTPEAVAPSFSGENLKELVKPETEPNLDFDKKSEFEFDEPVEEFAVEEPVLKEPKPKRGYVAIAAALSLVFVTGAGAYYLFSSSDNNEIVVAASNDPIKVKPEEPGGKIIPNQDRTVYETLSGEETAQSGESQLIDRSEKPIVGLDKQDDRIQPRVVLPGPGSENTVISSTRPPRGTKTVRTVTIRPDGTLVRNEAQEQRAPTQEVKEAAPSIVANNSDAVSDVSAKPIQNLTPRSVNTQALSANENTVESQVEEGVPETVTPVRQAVVPPLPRQNTFRNQIAAVQSEQNVAPTNLAPSAPRVRPPAQQAETQAAVTPPVQPAAPAQVANVETSASPAVNSAAGFFVQLSSQRSEEQARTTFNSLKRRFSVLSSYSANIQRADLGDRGVYHRLRVGPFSREESVRLCETLKSSGGDCIIARR